VPGEDGAMSYRIWSEIRNRQLLDVAFVWASDRLIFKNGVDPNAARDDLGQRRVLQCAQGAGGSRVGRSAMMTKLSAAKFLPLC
jgi:hypothetical protein